MLVVAALGGNALLRRGEKLTSENQRKNVKKAVRALADVVRAGNQLVVTHGNGPQIGLLALQNTAFDADNVFPLDILGAESEGMIGYLIEQELENQLGEGYSVATIITQITVDAEDPSLKTPTKFIGPEYEHEQTKKFENDYGWTFAKDGDKWRRVVPSPDPQKIQDLKVLNVLLEQQIIPICIGGGGIPIVRQDDGSYAGIEAVIDKDAASALLADQINADALLLLTDVDAVYHNFGDSDAESIAQMSVQEAEAFDAPEGSMGPKLKAAAGFAKQGEFSAIGRVEDALEVFQGIAGTRVSDSPLHHRG